MSSCVLDFTCDAEQVGSVRSVAVSLILLLEPMPLPPPSFADGGKILCAIAQLLELWHRSPVSAIAQQ